MVAAERLEALRVMRYDYDTHLPRQIHEVKGRFLT